MGFFGVDKSNKSTTTNETTNTYTDTSANAGGDGSFAAGAGASINIQNLSEKVATSAIDNNSFVAATAIDANERALTGGYNLARSSVDSGLKQTEYTVNTIAGLQEVAARENQDTRNAAQQAISTNAGLTEKLNTLTSDALAKAQAPEATSIALIMKPLLVAVSVIAGIFFLSKMGSKTPSAAKA
jgi:hypothetical protein